MYSFSEDFKQFISPDCNRGEFIQNYLQKTGVEAPAIHINGKYHIYVKFPKEQYNPNKPIKTVLAHYDRFADSPGANDNSSSVFCMLQWVERLIKKNEPHNIRILFTDGEELGEDGVKSQGAFDIAVLFKRLGILNDDIYVFDCMGRGTVPVICLSHSPKVASVDFKRKYILLESKAENLLRKVTKNAYMKLPASYSDNAGFIANGIPAIAITMLPYDEALLYKNSLFNNTHSSEINLPLTWKMFHTQEDNLMNLTPESFELTSQILDELAKSD